MTRRISFVAAIALVSTPCWAGDGVFRANDTGGIISWSPAVAPIYRRIAADHCARFHKIAVISSVHRRYGDFIGFRCYFPRGYDPRKDMVTARSVVRVLY